MQKTDTHTHTQISRDIYILLHYFILLRDLSKLHINRQKISFVEREYTITTVWFFFWQVLSRIKVCCIH
jgi:hypothetical protein